MKLGLVGYGYDGKKLVSVLEKLPNHPELTTIWTRRLSENQDLQKLAASSSIDVYEGEDSFLDFARSVDMMIISTPPSEHYWQATEALRANPDIRLLVEKPVCPTYEDARKLWLRGRRGKVHVCCQLRHHSAISDLKESIDLPAISKVEIKMLKFKPRTGWKRNPEVAGGGVWMDIGPHILDLLEYLGIWPIEEIEGQFEWEISSQEGKRGIEHDAKISAKKEGISIRIELSTNTKSLADRRDNKIAIFGQEEGEDLILDFSGDQGWELKGPRFRNIYEKTDPRALLLADWLKGGENCTTLASATEHIRLIEAAFS